jgi:hypothetical protein
MITLKDLQHYHAKNINFGHNDFSQVLELCKKSNCKIAPYDFGGGTLAPDVAVFILSDIEKYIKENYESHS